MRPTTIAHGAPARYLVRLRCLGCGQRSLAAPPVLLGMCPRVRVDSWHPWACGICSARAGHARCRGTMPY